MKAEEASGVSQASFERIAAAGECVEALSPPQVERDIADIVSQYKLSADWRALKRQSGMNNTTRVIHSAEGSFALRIYDNHQNRDIVLLEHEVLTFLASGSFPLQVPMPIANARGETVTASDSGKLASLFRYIEGERPNADRSEHIESLGRAAGMLSAALAHYGSESKPQYQPYYELPESYAGWTDEKLLELADRAGMQAEAAEAVARVLAARRQMDAAYARLRALPHQWIHGDLNFSNAVAVGDRVVGILDFEFATVDLRAMEPAVATVDFIRADRSDEQRLSAIERFASGFGSACKLSADEANAIPLLMKLRMLDVFLHFAGRCAEELDPPSVWEGQIMHADDVCRWIDSSGDELSGLLLRHLSE